MTQYQVILESPLGERGGILTLCENGEGVTGTLSLLGIENHVTGSWKGDTLALRHQLRTSLSTLACSTLLCKTDGVLQGTVRSGAVCMRLRGEEIKEKAERKFDHGTADHA